MIRGCKKKKNVYCRDVQAVFDFGLMVKVLNKLLKVTQNIESTSQTLIARTLMADVNPSIHLLYGDRCQCIKADAWRNPQTAGVSQD